jgi:hypothetical protein
MQMNKAEIIGALARGYCTGENRKKVMDSALVLAMADEILALQPQGEPVAWAVVWKIDGKELIQFPIQISEKDAAAQIRYYNIDDQKNLQIRPLTYADAPPADEVVVPREQLKVACIWLRGAVDCKQFHWDTDQKESAGASCAALEQLLAAPKGGE